MAGIDVATLRIPNSGPPHPPPPPPNPDPPVIDVLPQDVVEAVATANMLVQASGPSTISNLAYANMVANVRNAGQNAISNQQAMNEVNLTVTGKSVANVANLGPLEARSAVDVLTNDEIAQTLADMKATIAAMRRPAGAQ